VQQRDIDLANLNELNRFIVQHLRESILVVDETDAYPAHQRHGGATARGWQGRRGHAARESVAPRLFYLLDARGDGRSTTVATRPARSCRPTAAQ
jgi:two-component system, NtrC family, sensor histidine kinase PilS